MAIDTSRPAIVAVPRLELRDSVTAALRELIFTGAFATGERLVETELAERFGTSRGPVRDAFAELEQVGLLTSGRGKGTYVRELTTVDVDELYTLRQSLETLAVRRAVERLGETVVDELNSHVTAMEEAFAADDPVAAASADMAFHRTILEGADHSRLLVAWERLADQTRLLMQALSQILPEQRLGGLDHGPIVRAFETGNSAAAEAAIGDHLDQARSIVMQSFAARDAASDLSD